MSRRPAATLPLLPLLAGCGFTPLYAEHGVGPSLQAVAVETPLHSRTAYFLRQSLDDELGRDRGAAPVFRLTLTFTENRFPLGVRVNNVASRYEVDLAVTWRLIDAGTGTQLTAGVTPVRVSYASADPPYAGVAAEQDGEERAAKEAAWRMRQSVARWIGAHPHKDPDAVSPTTPAVVPTPALESATSKSG